MNCQWFISDIDYISNKWINLDNYTKMYMFWLLLRKNHHYEIRRHRH
jgi:hypothetical protein